MIITYKVDGEPDRAWPFDPNKLMSPECEAIERVTKMDYAQFTAKVAAGNALARRAIVWVMLKREHPTLKFEDVSFPYGAFDLEYSKVELDELEKQVKGALPEDELNEALAGIEMLRKTAYDVIEGKAVSQKAE